MTTISHAPLLVDRTGSVEIWTMNLPEARNPISGDDMVDALVSAVARVNSDPSVRVVILTGSGPAFSAGGNVHDMAQRRGLFGGAPHQQRTGYRDGIQRIPRALLACEVPMIAAVNGPAVGAGCDLALMCDLRIAASTAFFAENFVTVGLIPGDGGAWLLPRAVGAARAAEMALTGKRIDAQTALAWGLVCDVVEPEDLLTRAREVADQIAANPPIAVRMTKKLLQQSEGNTVDTILELSAAMQTIAHQSKDHAEAVAAFIERRPPTFTGE